MKNLLISFTYNDFAFLARVLVHKKDDTILYSILLIENDANGMLQQKSFIFTEDEDGFLLMLLHADSSFEVLDWEIRFEFEDELVVAHADVFSLS